MTRTMRGALRSAPSALRSAPSALRRRLPARPGPVILMYHRVADRPVDPWGLCVSPTRFAAQLQYLRANRVPLPLDDFVAALRRGTLPPLAVAVTFDDGYLDNAATAAPLLAEAGIPATFFLTTATLGSGRPFWWDELAALTLGHPGPADHTVTVGTSAVAVHWEAVPNFAAGWRAWDPPRTAREHAYHQLWTALHHAGPADRDAALDQIRSLLGPAPTPDPLDLPMDLDEAAALAARPLVDIGAHSCTHPALAPLPDEAQEAEIAGSRRALEALLGRPVTGFAYPHGSRTPTTRRLTTAAGFTWACSTEPASVHPAGADPFDLPRLGVGDWSADELHQALAPGALPRSTPHRPTAGATA